MRKFVTRVRDVAAVLHLALSNVWKSLEEERRFRRAQRENEKREAEGRGTAHGNIFKRWP